MKIFSIRAFTHSVPRALMLAVTRALLPAMPRVLMLAAGLSLTLASCRAQLNTDGTDVQLSVRIKDSWSQNATKIAYSGAYGEHTEFETADYFGLFVLDENEVIQVANKKVYCSGIDNKGNTVWSIFKEGSGEGSSSNHTLAEILEMGHQYFAYYPYDEAYDAITKLAQLQAVVGNFGANLPKDQSASFTACDFLVASNIPGCEYGEVTVEGKSVSLVLGHTFAMLRLLVPSGATKYSYIFDGSDFTPCKVGSSGGMDELRYIFVPGCILSLSFKYVLDDKLYKLDTGGWSSLFPIITEGGHCYYVDESAVKIPYSVGVDMGTSVMWAPFNLGVEDNYETTPENAATFVGTIVMWGPNTISSSYGPTAYKNYNSSFTLGTPPSELPIGYDYSGNVIYDSASNLWRGKWRTPTIAEWKELFSACTYVYDSKKIVFTSKTTGNTLTIPFAGYYDSGTATSAAEGYYWSSSASTTDIAKASSTFFKSGGAPRENKSANRYTGLPIRPVFTR